MCGAEPIDGGPEPASGPGAYQVTLSGEYDETNAEEMRSRLLAGLGQRIEVDCAAVTYLGSVGLAVLMDVRQQAEAAGGGLVLTAVSNIVHTLLDATDLTSYLLAPGVEGA